MSFNTTWNGKRGRGHGPRSQGRGWHGNYTGHVPGVHGPGPSTFFSNSRRNFASSGARGNFNQMFQPPLNINDQFWPYRNEQPFYLDEPYELPSVSQDKPFLSPPRCSRTPPRATSPLPGSEEYMQRDISEKSALLKRELELEGSGNYINLSSNSNLNSDGSESNLRNSIDDDNNKCVQEESVNLRSNKFKKQSSRQVQMQTTLNVDEIHHKIINHISNLSYNKKFNIVNQSGPSGYDFAIQQITRQKRLELSRALRDMCNNQFKQSDESSAVINSIIPDFDIKIETLPRDLVQQLSSTLNEDIGECLQNVSAVDPEVLFQQAADMLTFSDGFDSSQTSLHMPIEENDQHIMISNVSVASEYNGDKNADLNQLDGFDALDVLPSAHSSLSQPLLSNQSFVDTQNIHNCEQTPLVCENLQNVSTSVPTDCDDTIAEYINESSSYVNVTNTPEIIINVPDQNIPLLETSTEIKERPIILSDIVIPPLTVSQNIIVNNLEPKCDQSNQLKKVNFTLDNLDNFEPLDNKSKSTIIENVENKVEPEHNNKEIQESHVKLECDSKKIVKKDEENIKVQVESVTDNNQDFIKLENDMPIKNKKVEKIMKSKKEFKAEIADDNAFNENNVEQGRSRAEIDEENVEVQNTKGNSKNLKHKSKNMDPLLKECIIETKQLNPEIDKPKKKVKTAEKIKTKTKHVDKSKTKPELSDSGRYLEDSKQEILTSDRSRSLSIEIDKNDKKHDKLIEKSHSRSRSDEKDLYQLKYNEPQNPHRSERSRYDKFQTDKYDESYRKYHQEEDRRRHSYDKYREHAYSPESEHDLHWYSKYAERDEVRHSKRYHYEKAAYLQRSKYIDSKSDYQDSSNYYRREVSFSPEKYDEQAHTHYHKTKHAKSHKKSSKKHKRRKEVSLTPSETNSSSSSEDNLSTRSSKQRSPELIEERSLIKHKKPLKERIQMLNEFKSFDKKEETSESFDSFESLKIKVEPTSPKKVKLHREVHLAIAKEPKVYNNNNIHEDHSHSHRPSTPLESFADNLNSDINSLKETRTVSDLIANKSNFGVKSLKVIATESKEVIKNNVLQDKLPLLDNNPPDLSGKTNETPDNNSITDLSDTVKPTDSTSSNNKLEEPKKPVQRPWKSPGEKKFMMEQLNKNSQQSISEHELLPENVAENPAFVTEQQACVESDKLATSVHENYDNVLDNTETLKIDTEDFQKAEVLHSAEVSSTSDTSGKNAKLELIKDTTKTSVTIAVAPRNPVIDSPMFVTTYTQTIDLNAPKKDDKKPLHNKRKHRLYNIGIQVGVSHHTSATQTPILKYKNIYIQADKNKMTTFKTVLVQTEASGMMDDYIELDDKAPRKVLKAKRRQNAIRKMLDLDNEIQKLQHLRQSLYKELEFDSTSDDDYEERIGNSNKRGRKMTTTLSKSIKIEPSKFEKSKSIEKEQDIKAKSNPKKGRKGKNKEPKNKKLKTKIEPLDNQNIDESYTDNAKSTLKESNDLNNAKEVGSVLNNATEIILSELSSAKTCSNKEDLTESQNALLDITSPPITENLALQEANTTPKVKKSKLKKKRTESETLLSDQNRLFGVQDLIKNERTRSLRRLSISNNDSHLQQNDKHVEMDVSVNNDDLGNANLLQLDKKDDVEDEKKQHVETKETELSLNDCEDTEKHECSLANHGTNIDAECFTQKGMEVLEVPEITSGLSTVEMFQSPQCNQPKITKDDTGSDTTLENIKLSKIGKKRKCGPRSKTIGREKFFAIEENYTKPALVGVVKIARYSISQLEDIRNRLRSVASHYNEVVSEVTDEKDDVTEQTETILCKSELIVNELESEKVPEVEPVISCLEASTAGTELRNICEDAVEDATVCQNKTTNDYEVFFKGFTGAILAIKVINETVLAATDQGQVIFFNITDTDIIHSLKVSTTAITSMLVLKNGDSDNIFVGSLDTSLTVINFNNKEICKTQKLDEPIQCMENAWDYIFIGSDRGSLIRFDLKNDLVEGVVKIAETNVLTIKATNEGPRKVLVIATRNEPVSIRDACSGLLLRSLQTSFLPTVYTLLFHQNQIYCGTSQHDILVYTFEDGQLILRHEATKSKGVVCMQIVGNLLFAGCYNGNIYVYNTKTNVHLGTMTGPGGLMLSMEIVYNKIIIVGTKSSNFKAWNVPQEFLNEM